MNLLIVGVPGYNRGDDAILLGLIRLIQRYESTNGAKVNVRFFTQKLLPDACFADYVQVLWDRRDYKFHLSLVKHLFWSDIVMLGGGSIIQDKFGAGFLKGITGAYTEVSFLAKLLGKRVITAPIGVDKLHSERGHRVAKFVLSRIDDLAVRDEDSLNIASSIIGRERPFSCTVTGDPALALAGVFRGAIVPGRLVLCPAYEGQNLSELIDFFRSIASRHLNCDSNNTVCFLAMDERPNEDAGFIDMIKDHFPNTDRVTYLTPGGVEETISLIRSADIIISMRLHPLILSLGNCFAFSVSRGPKMESFVKRYSLPGVVYSDARNDPGRVYDAAASFRASVDNNHLQLNRTTALQHADDIFDFLDKSLKLN